MTATTFLELLDQRRTDYKTWSPIYCPSLREYVHFPMPGFNHLRFKTNNTPRKPAEVKYKIGLLPLVRPVISNAVKVDRYERRLAPMGGSRTIVLKEYEYWGILANVGKSGTKTRVVLRRQVGSKQINFWSVMKYN